MSGVHTERPKFAETCFWRGTKLSPVCRSGHSESEFATCVQVTVQRDGALKKKLGTGAPPGPSCPGVPVVRVGGSRASCCERDAERPSRRPGQHGPGKIRSGEPSLFARTMRGACSESTPPSGRAQSTPPSGRAQNTPRRSVHKSTPPSGAKRAQSTHRLAEMPCSELRRGKRV